MVVAGAPVRGPGGTAAHAGDARAEIWLLRRDRDEDSLGRLDSKLLFFSHGRDIDIGPGEVEVQGPGAVFGAAVSAGWLKFPLFGGAAGDAGEVIALAGRDVVDAGNVTLSVDFSSYHNTNGAVHAFESCPRDAGHDLMGDCSL